MGLLLRRQAAGPTEATFVFSCPVWIHSMLSLVRADGSSGPFPQEDRATQRSLFIWFFHLQSNISWPTKFPKGTQIDPQGNGTHPVCRVQRCLCVGEDIRLLCPETSFLLSLLLPLWNSCGTHGFINCLRNNRGIWGKPWTAVMVQDVFTLYFQLRRDVS